MSTVAERVGELSRLANLTEADIGRIVGVSPQVVARWTTEEIEQSSGERDRLLDLHNVVQQLADGLGLTPADVNVWLLEPNQLLQGGSPVDRLEVVSSGRFSG